MKKTLRFSLLSIMLLVCGMVSAETVTFDFTGASAYGMTLLSGSTTDYNADPYVCTEGDVTMTLTGKTRWWKASGGNELRFYKESFMTFAAPAGAVITKVVLNAKAKANWTTSVGTYADGTWTGSQASVAIATTITEKNTPIYSAEVTYQSTGAPVKKNPNLAFASNAVTAELGKAFTAPTLTKETTADVAYTSSDTKVATVNAATGAVTIVAVGKTTITATAAETAEYAEGKATYTLTVTAPVVLASYTLANTIESGKAYLMVANHEGALKASQMSSKGYEYLQVADVTASNDVIEANQANEILIEAVDGGYTMKQTDGRYIYQTGAYNSFNFNAARQTGDVWTITANLDGTFKILNNSVNKYIQYDPNYKSYGSYDKAQGIMPNLYVKGNATAINGISSNNNAKEQMIFNLAGQRLNKVQKGINIINGKKVVVK